ncbi:hypothetical protein niasHT_038471 [Heterodera trifolii]|uniref:Uncharacterized protein n=1 Tax=Heterodera trifolii TaxID=157864 RepID=A0ABD2IXM6_9BILA
MASFDNDDPEVSRVFAQKEERRFQRNFGRFMHNQSSGRGGDDRERQNHQRRASQQQQIDHMSVKLIEANESIALLRRQLESRDEEIEQLRRAESVAGERVADAQREAIRWRTEAERGLRRVSSGRNLAASTESGEFAGFDKLLLSDYRSALSKYRTWSLFADKQLQTMKQLLEECGGWTEPNRYKIYFSYRNIEHEHISHENVAELASGSTIGNYFGAIEDVENISAIVVRPKFHTVQTQTEDSNNNEMLLNSSFCAEPGADNDMDGSKTEGMTAQELRMIDYERDIERLEIQCSKQHEQLIILSERAKHVELLEEQKVDLQTQTDILRRQNAQLIRDHEELKCLFGGGSISRNGLEELVRSAGQLREKNKELETKLKLFESQQQLRDAPTVGESRRIAQLFKRKYDAELNELRSKLQKYEEPTGSDTTRILRFATANPLDEARDELVIREVAAAAASASTGASAPNPLKRRKLDNSVGDELAADETPVGDEFGEETEDSNDGHVHNLRVQIRALKEQLDQTENVNAELLREFRETVALISGYDVRIGEEGFFEAESVHSKNCVFLFQKHGQQPPTVDLLDNECAQRWKDLISNYLVRYNSVPAFLSAVTISLVESPEDFVSGSQQSSQQSVSSADVQQ